ncbi:S41 family peptidase [Salmonirosea aquatica]
MKNLAFVILISLSVKCFSQSTDKFNLNFEKYAPGQNLNQGGWFQWGGYELGLDSTTVHSGKHAASITSDPKGAAFGSVAYRIPANYEGKSITLEGYMKTQGVENGHAGLLMRVDSNAKVLAFDNMQNQKITGTNDWKKYSITLAYPANAEHIYVAGILVGKGKAWFDDFVLTIDGQNIQTLKEKEGPVFKANSDHEFDAGSKVSIANLDEKKVGNLALLGKVWGFLKYYHPEVGKGNYNMDYELFRVLPDYLQVKNDQKRDQVLLSWVNGFGKVPLCEKCEETPEDAPLKPDFSWISDSQLDPKLEEALRYIYKNRNQGEHYYIKTAGVGNPQFMNENSYANQPYPDAGFRLLALYRYWNAIQYFFPYKPLTDKDWKNVLKEYIPTFIDAKTELEYELAALQIIGEVKDTHANLWDGGNAINASRGKFYPPFSLQFVEDKLVVADYYKDGLKSAAGLSVGDVITHINGASVEHLVDSLNAYYPASNQPTRLRNISMQILRSKQNVVPIKYFSASGSGEKELTLYPVDQLEMKKWYEKSIPPKSYKLLENNIGYVTLKTIKEQDIPVIKDSLNNTKGIIMDIRNYPSTFVPFSLGTYFISKATPFVKFTGGNVNNPGEFSFSPPVVIPKENPAETYKGKLVVLVNEQTQSQAEYTAMAFRAGDNTTIMGSTTAGADGNVSNLVLPGGLGTMISGLGVYYPDGTETQRVGIIPDIEVKPTIEGIKSGKDELLERAIEFILK